METYRVPSVVLKPPLLVLPIDGVTGVPDAGGARVAMSIQKSTGQSLRLLLTRSCTINAYLISNRTTADECMTEAPKSLTLLRMLRARSDERVPR